MPCVSGNTSTSTGPISSRAPRTRAQLKESRLASSSRASSDVPADHETISTRASSTSVTGTQSSSQAGASTTAATSPSQSLNHTRRQTRSTPADELIYGPQHLEHEYNLAYEELRSTTIYALYRLGYTNPKRKSPDEQTRIPSLEMVLAARFPDVERARRRINEADRKLKEALEMGQNWYNTPWPNYRVIYDEQGMAVDVIEVAEGEEDIDDDELELQRMWAKFATPESADRKLSGRGTKRKYQEPGTEIRPEKQQRLDVETSSSQGSFSFACKPIRGLHQDDDQACAPATRFDNVEPTSVHFHHCKK